MGLIRRLFGAPVLMLRKPGYSDGVRPNRILDRPRCVHYIIILVNRGSNMHAMFSIDMIGIGWCFGTWAALGVYHDE